MSEFKGTPGPWSMSSPPYDSIPWHHMYGPDGKHIMHADRPDDEKIASVRLIAAAPDLLEALSWFINDIDGTHTVMVDFDANVERARNAIAKALQS